VWANANHWHLRSDQVDEEVIRHALSEIRQQAAHEQGLLQYLCIRLDWDQLLIVTVFETEDDARRARRLVAKIHDYYDEHVESVDLSGGEVLLAFGPGLPSEAE
jgi:hypothetical protein